MVTAAGGPFPRTARIRSPADFSRVFAFRRSAAGDGLVLHACPSPTGRTRLGLSVSRRVGGAVVRNRWKRRVREAFRELHGRLPPATDIVIVVRATSVPAGAEGARTVANTIAALADRVTSRPGYAAAAAESLRDRASSGTRGERRR